MPMLKEGVSMAQPRFSTITVGTVEPPPAVTFNRAAVDTRVRQLEAYSPYHRYGLVSSMRSTTTTLPSTRLGYGSDGRTMRRCTMYGSARAVLSASLHSSAEASHPSTIPLPPYSSLGLSTNSSLWSAKYGSRSMPPPSSWVRRSATTRVQGI